MCVISYWKERKLLLTGCICCESGTYDFMPYFPDGLINIQGSPVTWPGLQKKPGELRYNGTWENYRRCSKKNTAQSHNVSQVSNTVRESNM